MKDLMGGRDTVQRNFMLLILLPALAGGVGYLLGTERASPGAVASPPGAPAPAAATAIDWATVSERDLVVAPVFWTAQREGVSAALDTLEAIVRREPAVARFGHSTAHQLGRFAIAARAGDGDGGGGAVVGLLQECRPIFRAGCNHGVVEGYLASVERVDPEALTALCTALQSPGTPVIEVRECAHGLGHGLLERLGYEFRPALAACDVFESEALREECHDGVFMQNLVHGVGLPSTTGADAATEHDHGAGAHGAAAAASSSPAGSGFRAGDLSFPCNTLDIRYSGSCWSYQPRAIRRFLRDNGERTLMSCDQLAPPPARARCYAGYAKQALSWFGQDEELVIAHCARAPRPYDGICLGGVVEAWVDEEWGADAAIAFCQRVDWTLGNATACARAVGERVALLHVDPAAVERECARLESPRYVAACREGAGLG